MGWVKALLVAIQLAAAEVSRRRALAKQKHRDNRRGVVRESPNKAAADLFGPSRGRLRIADGDQPESDVQSNATTD